MITSTPLLRRALNADAIASGAMGLAMSVAPRSLGALLQLPDALLLKIGLFSVLYAALVGWMASRAALPRGLVMFVIFGNAGWTIASFTLLASQIVTPNLLGYAFVAAQAMAVGVFAELQFIGLRRSEAALTA